MIGAQNRIHDLASAIRVYRERTSRFPRGTLDRPPESNRHGRPYPPDLRLSWMVELLPYLGHDDVFMRIQKNKAWRDPENVGLATTLIPQFVDSQYPKDSWWVRYPGLRDAVAATHFVGLAGIGLDAADYSANDPATLPKLGMFGYDRETRPADVTDGLSNTILAAQVPPTFKRPWMASGGSTVQGVPETHSVQPFVSTQQNGKKGTLVIMADGAVRFVSENISDDVFKALVTIKGGEPVLLNREAPLVPRSEQQAELKAQPIGPPATPLTPPAPAQKPEKQPAAGPQVEWKEYSSKEAGFSVLIPGTPVETGAAGVRTAAGATDIRNYEVTTTDGQRYLVVRVAIPVTLQGRGLQAWSDIAGSMLMAPTGGRSRDKKSEKKIELDGKSGRELEYDFPSKGVVKSRSYDTGRYVFHLAAGPATTAENIDKFLNSFKLVAE
ncbi:MAG: DUF1559 domain-containing protein [Gemmataceae bacterium]|nr:DUF1559 domain-containing protein [Gemmataceae bacterium]